VIAPRSRHRAVTDKDQKASWGKRIAKRYLGANALGSSSLSGPGQAASASPVILGVKADHGESERKVQDVLVKVYDPGRLQRAWQQVRKNAGAAGIDQMTVAEFAQREDELLALIHDKLKSGSYRFQPARRVEIPKPGTSKKRKLGIPVVMDRIVGTSMHSVLEEIFDADFTASNFGFRAGRSQHQAIRQLQRLVQEGRDWAVAVDLQAFFDEIPHGLILQLMRRKVADEQFVTLLARLLKAGVVVAGVFEKTTRGCPQGSPLSPILSNLVLNELDHKLEERNLGYCRWADDCVPRRRTAGHMPCVQPCCTRDEGRPLAAAVQAEAANRPLRLRSRGVVVSELGKGRARPGQVRTVESNASEPLMTCRKRRNDVETGGSRYPGTSLGATCLLPRRRPA